MFPPSARMRSKCDGGARTLLSAKYAWRKIRNGRATLGTTLDRRQQNRRARSDHQSMLKVRRERVVAGPHSPPVFVGKHSSGTRGDDRFNGNDEAIVHNLPGRGVWVVGHVRRLMDGATDAVSPQFADDGEA